MCVLWDLVSGEGRVGTWKSKGGRGGESLRLTDSPVRRCERFGSPLWDLVSPPLKLPSAVLPQTLVFLLCGPWDDSGSSNPGWWCWPCRPAAPRCAECSGEERCRRSEHLFDQMETQDFVLVEKKVAQDLHRHSWPLSFHHLNVSCSCSATYSPTTFRYCRFAQSWYLRFVKIRLQLHKLLKSSGCFLSNRPQLLIPNLVRFGWNLFGES